MAWRMGLACVAAVFLLSASFAQALPPRNMRIDTVAVEARDEWLTIKLSVTVDSEDGLRDLLKDGSVLELSIAAQVERERSWWSNSTVSEKVFSSFIRHDPLNRDFFVTVPVADGVLELRDRNLTRLLHASWRKLVLPVESLEHLRFEGEADEYVVSLRISLQHAEVPPWLQKGSVFWSSDVVPQEKRILRFVMPPVSGAM